MCRLAFVLRWTVGLLSAPCSLRQSELICLGLVKGSGQCWLRRLASLLSTLQLKVALSITTPAPCSIEVNTNLLSQVLKVSSRACLHEHVDLGRDAFCSCSDIQLLFVEVTDFNPCIKIWKSKRTQICYCSFVTFLLSLRSFEKYSLNLKY